VIASLWNFGLALVVHKFLYLNRFACNDQVFPCCVHLSFGFGLKVCFLRWFAWIGTWFWFYDSQGFAFPACPLAKSIVLKQMHHCTVYFFAPEQRNLKFYVIGIALFWFCVNVDDWWVMTIVVEIMIHWHIKCNYETNSDWWGAVNICVCYGDIVASNITKICSCHLFALLVFIKYPGFPMMTLCCLTINNLSGVKCVKKVIPLCCITLFLYYINGRLKCLLW